MPVCMMSRILEFELSDNISQNGFEVYDPEMFMFTLGGGGVHCHAQALCRDECS